MSKLMVFMGIVALFGVALASSIPKSHAGKGQEIIGPIEWNCTRNGAFPYLECDKYVDCWEGAALLGQCTELMLFDLNYNGCNFAQNVDCGDRLRPTNVPSTITPPMSTTTSNVSTTTTEGPSEEFECPYDGVFANEERCEYYWECYGGNAVLHHCQQDYLFDLVFMGCNFPELTHCQDRERPPGVKPTTYPPPSTVSTTEYTGPTTTTETPEFNCPNDGVFPDEDKCEYFWSCYVGIAERRKCQGDFLFDLEYMGCNYPELTHCQDRERPPGVKPTTYPPISTTTTAAPEPTTVYTGPTTTRDPNEPSTTTTAAPGPFQCPKPEGNFADPLDCTAFYQCSLNIAYHQFCPDGLFFNPLIETCDFPQNVDCKV